MYGNSSDPIIFRVLCDLYEKKYTFELFLYILITYQVVTPSVKPDLP